VSRGPVKWVGEGPKQNGVILSGDEMEADYCSGWVSTGEECRLGDGHVLEWVATRALLGGEVLVHDESRAAHRELSCKRLLGEIATEEAVAKGDDALGPAGG
jgi:hypothetical protein